MLKEHFYNLKEPCSTVKNLFSNEKMPWVLKVPYEALFIFRVKMVMQERSQNIHFWVEMFLSKMGYLVRKVHFGY